MGTRDLASPSAIAVAAGGQSAPHGASLLGLSTSDG
tara:strand:- start:1176 stop:1283 length:108 start_codon:yes stop_codon:yes gene_type:complete